MTHVTFPRQSPPARPYRTIGAGIVSERSLLRYLDPALRRQHSGDGCLVLVHVGEGRESDARRLDDVDGVDADARTDVAWRRGVVPRRVGRDDDGDDAPVPVPTLRRYRQAVGGTVETYLGRLTALVGVAYFVVWTVFGMAVFPLGIALAGGLNARSDPWCAPFRPRLA